MLRLGFRSTDRISKWEKGTRLPNMINLFKLAAIYNVSPIELYPEIAQTVLRSHIPDSDPDLE
jgi:transcriptional regulator with XRE-family HTH domain